MANACELIWHGARVSTTVGKGLGVWQTPHGRMDRQIGGNFVCRVPGVPSMRGGMWWGCRELDDLPGALWWGAADYSVSPNPVSLLRRIAIGKQLNLGGGICASQVSSSRQPLPW